MPDIRHSRMWDRQLEEGLPDCRTRYGERETVMHGRTPMEIVYCAQCHEARGMVFVNTPHVFFICDDCYFKSGETTPPGTVWIGE